MMMMMITNINESQQRRTYPTSLHTRVGVKILTDALYFLVAWEGGEDYPLVDDNDDDDGGAELTTLISCPIHILVASFFSKILLVKNIDHTAGNIDESIKNTKEGKSQKKAQSASEFSHLQVKVHTGRGSPCPPFRSPTQTLPTLTISSVGSICPVSQSVNESVTHMASTSSHD